MAIFDPDLFAGLEDILDAYPEAIKELLGSVIDIGTIEGYFTIEFLSLINTLAAVVCCTFWIN